MRNTGVWAKDWRESGNLSMGPESGKNGEKPQSDIMHERRPSGKEANSSFHNRKKESADSWKILNGKNIKAFPRKD